MQQRTGGAESDVYRCLVYLADDSAADVKNQKPEVVSVSSFPAIGGGGVLVTPPLRLVANRCVPAAHRAPASARSVATPTATPTAVPTTNIRLMVTSIATPTATPTASARFAVTPTVTPTNTVRLVGIDDGHVV